MTVRLRSAQSLSTIVHNASESLGSYARWPEAKARQDAVAHDLAILREALHGHDPIVPNSICVWLMFELMSDMTIRDNISQAGMAAAITKFAELVKAVR